MMHGPIILIPLVSLWLVASGWAATTYLNATAETGVVNPPWDQYPKSGSDQPTTSTVQKKNGTRSYRVSELDPGTSSSNGSKLIEYSSVDHASDPGGAYFSAWYYIDNGHTADNKWRNNMQWKGSNIGDGCDVGAKTVIGFSTSGPAPDTIVQVRLGITDCGTAVVNNGGVVVDGGCSFYRSSPTAVPMNQWFHLETYYKAAKTNGAMKVWQDGALVYDLSGANFDTLTRQCVNNPSVRSQNIHLYWGVGSYSDPSVSATQSMYIDDILVTDFQVSATATEIPNPPTNLTVTSTAPDTNKIEWTKATQNTDASSYTDADGIDLRWCINTACTPPNPPANIIDAGLSDTGCTATSPRNQCYLHIGLNSNTVYGYDVLSRDTSDQRSASSGIQYVTTATGPPPTLRAHYDMEDGPTGTLMDDQTANNFDGTLCSGATCPQQGPTWITGGAQQVGTYALSCDGINDNVSVADTATLDITGDMTIAFWLKLLSTTNLNASPPPIVLAKETSASPFTTAYAMYISESANPHLGYFHLPGSNNQFDAFPYFTLYTVPLNTWVHVALTRNTTTKAMRLYIGGNFVQQLTYGTDTPAATATPLMLCSGQSRSATQFANIALDDVRILTDIMSDADILTLAQGATGSSTLEASICRWRNIDTTETQAFQRPVGYEGQVVKGQAVQLRCAIHNTGALSPSFAPRLACRSPATSGTYFTVTDSCATNPLCLGTNIVRPAAVSTSAQLTVPAATFQSGGKFIPVNSGDWFVNIPPDTWMEFEWPLQLKVGAGELDLDDTIGCKVVDQSAADLDTVTEILGRVVARGGYSN